MWVLLWLLFLLRRLQLPVEHEQHVCLLKGNPSLAKLTTTPHTHSTHSTHSTHCHTERKEREYCYEVCIDFLASTPHTDTLVAAPGSLTPGYGYNALAGRRKTTTTNMEYSDSVSTHSVSDVIIYRYVNLAWLICVISLTTSNSERNL